MQTRHWALPTLVVASLLCAYVLGARAAGIPAAEALSYSGTLAEGGLTFDNPAYSIAVSLWDVQENGAPGTNRVCDTGTVQTEVVKGHFSVKLPEECTAAVAANPDLYVEIVAGGTVLVPRSKIRAVPFAVEAAHSVSAGTAAAANGALSAQLGALTAQIAALDTRIATLEAAPAPVTGVDSLIVPRTDPSHSGCFNQNVAFPAGACDRMAWSYCIANGYPKGGFFEGDLAPPDFIDIAIRCFR